MNTETCFTTVLWMALLLGYLPVQTHPTKPRPEICPNEIMLDELQTSTSCKGDLKFVVTSSVLLECEANALETNMIQLNRTIKECTADIGRINQTMEQLKRLQEGCTRVASSKLQSEPSKCKMWKSDSFETFFNSFKLFLQQLSLPNYSG